MTVHLIFTIPVPHFTPRQFSGTGYDHFPNPQIKAARKYVRKLEK
jgi:hypothetical protein